MSKLTWQDVFSWFWQLEHNVDPPKWNEWFWIKITPHLWSQTGRIGGKGISWSAGILKYMKPGYNGICMLKRDNVNGWSKNFNCFAGFFISSSRQSAPLPSTDSSKCHSHTRWWNPADGFPQQPHRQAMVQAQIAKLVASGQPKDSLLVFTREGWEEEWFCWRIEKIAGWLQRVRGRCKTRRWKKDIEEEGC